MNTREKITLQQLGAATKRTAERERSEFKNLQAETNKEDLVDQRKWQEERKSAKSFEEDVDVEETVVATRLQLLVHYHVSMNTEGFTILSLITGFDWVIIAVTIEMLDHQLSITRTVQINDALGYF
ncbi:hypothetical protein BpHYR1_036401 [Brachionus plicatilis]|uniref:Uncharacterized protein n=1 Tax=Brachionus plicatilis TaxID=10195 RepID=A0A3M7T614_BRAPC|nr:hypothetical protein BpHYR1_036401 [Brachionus plicatilis]